jgi:hypothetical protein
MDRLPGGVSLEKLRHSREGGNPVRSFLPEGRPIETSGAMRRKVRFWIPAFAGMTEKQPKMLCFNPNFRMRYVSHKHGH